MATWQADGPGLRPAKTTATKKAALTLARKCSRKHPGSYCDVMRNGITVMSCYRGKCKKGK